MSSFDDVGSAIENHTEEDENYFISMTDMMVGILFIFVIMLMVFALNFRQQTDVSLEQIKLLQKAKEQAEIVADRLESLRNKIGLELEQLDKSNRVRADLLQEIQQKLMDQGVVVEIDPANGVLRLTDNAVRFPSGIPTLSGDATDNVRKIAAALNEVLPRYTACRTADPTCESTGTPSVETVFVEGHTDRSGRDEDNWTLSTSRAVNTYRTMAEAQPSLLELQNHARRQLVSVSGYSSTRPLIDERTKAAYDTNRRIDLRFVMEIGDRQNLTAVVGLTREMEAELRQLRSAIDKANGK
ncbi:OmpA family protein [Mesorhizobium sp.]|uniref:OmpA/MotB family protein n=1 Tax=Mesorhizobium sp. TaxID=1871066 RepID=UPI000FE85ED4|nr:OmpA family protein [Mesorhizobium sp.]RWN25265.1 MAG: hypothetical protein EOR95_29140 [Mesorhizobium sp.]